MPKFKTGTVSSRKYVKLARSQLQQVVSSLIAQVPNTWLDARLTGPTAVIGKPPFTCQDIQNLCERIRKDMEKAANVRISCGAQTK